MILALLYAFVDLLKSTLSIAALVMVIMLLIEFINVNTSGAWLARLQKQPLLQIIIAALLGLVPGCAGGFAVVSLYTHKLLSFGALVAGMIATFGDEMFVIFAYSPLLTFRLMALVFLIGIAVGLIVHFLRHPYLGKKNSHRFVLHHDCLQTEKKQHEKWNGSLSNIKHFSRHKALLLAGLTIYYIAIFSGAFEHSIFSQFNVQANQTQEHDSHVESGILILLSFLVLVITLVSSEHFLREHLWKHVIKRHFPSIFLWTFGVLLCLMLLYRYVDINAFISQHQWAMLAILVLAVLVGLIPESGPHLIFVVMFFNGVVPFSILLTSSIVQDGHSALPLLAESRKSFIIMKLISAAAGLMVGIAGYLIGF